jgi:nucleoside-diphosphate kinase
MSESKILRDQLHGQHIILLVMAPNSAEAAAAGAERVAKYGTKVLDVTRIEYREPFKPDPDKPVKLSKRVDTIPKYPVYTVKCSTPQGLERTLAIMKPGAYKRHGWDEKVVPREFIVLRSEEQTWDKARAEAFYAEHAGRTYYDALIEHCLSGPCRVSLVEGVYAVGNWRTVIGNTDPKNMEYLGLRQQHGTEMPDNGWHGSDSRASARRETSIVFPA